MKIPFGQIETSPVSVGAPPMINLDNAAGASAGPGLQGVGRGLVAGADAADKWLEARSAVDISNHLTAAQGKLADYRTELESDPDTKGREAKFQAKAQELREAATDKLTGSHAIDGFNIRFNQLFRPMQSQVRQQARQEDLQNFRIDLSDTLGKMATQSVFARTQQEREAIQGEVDKKIYDSVRTGQLPAVAAMQFKKSYLGQVDGALGEEMVRANPSAAIAALGDPNKFPNLDATTRVRLRSQAQQRAESLGVQARAELRADATDFIADLRASPTTGVLPSEQEKDALLKRAGKSPIGVQLQHAWDFYNQVSDASTGQTIPQLQGKIADLQKGPIATSDDTLKGADAALKLTPQEKYLWGIHSIMLRLGGVKNEDGSTSTLSQMSFEQGGKTYNIPTIWPSGQTGKPERLSADDSIARANAIGIDRFPSYANEHDAEARYNGPGGMHSFLEKDGQPQPPTAEQLKQARVMQQALHQKMQARDADPATYTLKAYPTIAEQMTQADTLQASQNADDQAKASGVRDSAWAALIAAQKREGVPDHKVALLTKPQLDGMVDKLTATDGQARVDFVDTMRTQFGDRLPLLQAQLTHAGKTMPPDVDVLMSMPADANLPRTKIVEAYKVTPKQAEEVLGGTRMKEIDGAVRGRAASMALTMAQAPGGPQKLAGFQDAAERLARLYAIQGEGDSSKAAMRALDDVFYDHWLTVGTVRVPKIGGAPAAQPDDIRQAQSDVLAALPKMELMLPPAGAGVSESARRDMLVSAARGSGYWMTTGDDKGMVLMAGPGMPVRFSDGHPLILPFDSVNAGAADRGARSRLFRRELSQMHTGGDGEAIFLPQDLGADPDPDHVQLLPRKLQRYIVDSIRATGDMGGAEVGRPPQ